MNAAESHDDAARAEVAAAVKQAIPTLAYLLTLEPAESLVFGEIVILVSREGDASTDARIDLVSRRFALAKLAERARRASGPARFCDLPPGNLWLLYLTSASVVRVPFDAAALIREVAAFDDMTPDASTADVGKLREIWPAMHRASIARAGDAEALLVVGECIAADRDLDDADRTELRSAYRARLAALNAARGKP